ncbi:MAG: lipopolysaccharide biosynthesis protein RfbH [Nitrospirae bacterium]|nr:lipopolysaccharide biosynthesis protein RfbH [Nitrospirota bacterium]
MPKKRIKRGDIVELSAPLAGKSQKKKKEMYVVINIVKNYALVAALTSNLKYDGVFIEEDGLESGRLKNKLVVMIEKLNQVSAAGCNYIASLKMESFEKILRGIQFYFTTLFYRSIHKPTQNSEFIPGQSRINYAGRVFDEKEMINLIDSSLDFWLTAGKYAEKFERDSADFLGVKYCSLANSGSSANLLAFMALTSTRLGEKRIKKGDEVITAAAAFPTTVTPIIQYGAVPVFVDITLPTYNIDCAMLEKALSKKTKAVMLAHTLGNPFNLQAIKDFCDKHNLWLVEDNCDALGAKYLYNGEWKYTGTIGHIGTSSFYPPHHITMGEGGAVYTNDARLKRLIESFRDWGRDCWCPSGHDNTCRKRFKQQFGELPYGYDHKYVYSHLGYNLKVTDMQPAIGCAQLNKLPDFIELRKRNWRLLRNGLAGLSDKFILPEATHNSDPSWFGFLLTLRDNAGFTRSDIVNYLELNKIQTRMLFTGNILRHPCFDELKKSAEGYRIVGELKNTDTIMEQSFWVGVYPAITEEAAEFIIEKFHEFCRR